jgi:hypothetical protein
MSWMIRLLMGLVGVVGAKDMPRALGCVSASVHSNFEPRTCGDEDSNDSSCVLEDERGAPFPGAWDELIQVKGAMTFARKGNAWSIADLRTRKLRSLALPLDRRFHQADVVRPGLVVLRDGARARLEDVTGRVLVESVAIDTTPLLQNSVVLEKFCPMADSSKGCWMIANGLYPPGVLVGPKGFLALDARLGVPLLEPVGWSMALRYAPGLLYGKAGKIGLIDSAGRFVTPALYDGLTCVEENLRLHRQGKWGTFDAQGTFLPQGELPGPQRIEAQSWLDKELPGLKPSTMPRPSPDDEVSENQPAVVRDTFWYSGASQMPDSLRGRFDKLVQWNTLQGRLPFQTRARFVHAGAGKIRMDLTTLPQEDAKARQLLAKVRASKDNWVLDELYAPKAVLHAVLQEGAGMWEHWLENDLGGLFWQQDSFVQENGYRGVAWTDPKGATLWWDDLNAPHVPKGEWRSKDEIEAHPSWPNPALPTRSSDGEIGQTLELGGNQEWFGIQATDRAVSVDGNFEATVNLAGYPNGKDTLVVTLRTSQGEERWIWEQSSLLENGQRFLTPARGKGKHQPTLLVEYSLKQKDKANHLLEESHWRVLSTGTFLLKWQRSLRWDSQGRVASVQFTNHQ